MTKRLISAIIALIIGIPIILNGGLVYNLFITLLSLIGLYEFLKVKQSKKAIPLAIAILSFLVLFSLILTNITNYDLILKIDYRVIIGLFLAFLIPIVLYHDNKKYSINDAFYFIGSIFFLGISFSLMIMIRDYSLKLTIYLLLIATMTDTFAYITGLLIGKHKLLESISPKKTIEGMIGGTILGVFIPVVYYNTVTSDVSIFYLILMTFFLSIVGQLGDIVFSAIKRYYGVKDFSNIMPGHGGVLDRLDSIIFVLLSFMFFISYI